MAKTSFRVLTLIAGCMLFLSTTAQQVIAWPCPPPRPDCHTCTPTGWEYDCVAGESCCDDTCCNTSTQKCCDDIGGDDDGYCCDPTDICCQGVCCSAGQTCCNGTCCDSGNCCNNEICCNSGDSCCTDSGAGDAYCCAGGKTCCDKACCDPATQKCCDDIGGDNDGYCCDANDICCEGNCCDPNCEVCVDGNCVTIEVNSVSSDVNSAPICSYFNFTATTDPTGHEGKVKWSAPGGDPNSGSGATFSTRWPCINGKTVTATLCDSNSAKNVTVTLPTGCSAGSQTVSLYLIETCCPPCSDPDHCGETEYPTRYVGPDIDADYNDCHWEFSVSDIWSSDSDPCPGNFTEITDGNDPDLNAGNYCGIVDVFRNFHTCAKVGGINYGNGSCIEIHEDCHYNFMEENLETTQEEWLKGQSSMSDMTIDCSDSDTTTCQAAVNARESAILLDLAEAYDNAWYYMEAQGEQPCDDAAGPCVEDIADSICAVWDCNSC